MLFTAQVEGHSCPLLWIDIGCANLSGSLRDLSPDIQRKVAQRHLVPPQLPGHPGLVPLYRRPLQRLPWWTAVSLSTQTALGQASSTALPRGSHGPHPLPPPSWTPTSVLVSWAAITKTTDQLAKAIDPYFPHSSVRSLRPRCQQECFLRRPQPLVYRWPSSPCVFTKSSLCPKLFYFCFESVDLLFPYSKAVD